MLGMLTDDMQIEVKYGKEYYPIEVKKKDTVATLKWKIEKIEQFEHIPAERQTLRRYSSGPLLNDSNKTLEEYGITKGAVIFVTWDEFQIFVKFDGTKHSFVVKALDTVQNLKEKITQKIRILPEKQVLSRDKGGCYFVNEQTIENCGIVKDGTVFLSLDFQIRVTKVSWFDDESLHFKVMGTDTVQSLKDRIRKEKGAKWYSEGEIKLSKKYGPELVNNAATLDNYDIGPGDEIKFH
ncbi:hypothetical protein niasHT_025196 [Heterodera trifolii]|uniref:Ubiquitin-like domain-containing protein n=1 Tax=Heterodera trifolii TaxID=157864 RepID=A0ABD2JLS4_9BILA